MRAVADVINAQANQIRARAQMLNASAAQTKAQTQQAASAQKAAQAQAQATANQQKVAAALSLAQTKQATAAANLTAAQARAARAAQQHGTQQQFLGKQISHVTGVVGRLQAALKVVAAYTVAGALMVGLVSGLKSGVEEIVNFDQALKNLQAITGATDTELLGMSETAKAVARDTKFSATEIADGMTLLGQAGFSAEESMNAIRATATLATGTLKRVPGDRRSALNDHPRLGPERDRGNARGGCHGERHEQVEA